MLRTFLFITSFLAATLLLSAEALASACCGGNFSGPSLITGDDKALVSQSVSLAKIDTDVEASGLWRKRDQAERMETLNLQGSHVFGERWQAGASVPVIKRARSQETSSGFGDLSANLGYEYWPDWEYHPIRPKGIGYLQLILPTGKSIQESDLASQLDARGRGFWALGAGTVLTKNFATVDVFSQADLHKSFEKDYTSSQSSGRLKPGWGGSLGLGGGYHFSKYRFGTSLIWNYEDAVDVEGDIQSKGAPQRFVTAAVNLSWLLENEWSILIQAADQGLFGAPSNTTLSQTVMLQIQKRWLR